MTFDASASLPGDSRQTFRYVALGDSTAYGTGATHPDRSYVGRIATRLRAIYPDTNTTNLGINGAIAADVVARQLDRAIALQPTLVTLSIGPNDITHGRTPDAYEQDLLTIFRRLAQETAAVVVTNLLPDLGVVPLLPPTMLPFVRAITIAFNDALSRAASAYGAIVVDLYVPSQQQVPADARLLAADYYHPSDEGYRRWAEVMWRGIEQALPHTAER